jgi:hypothetical protein
MSISYSEALGAAGATVHEFRRFGSYQGDWYAYVTYKGQTGFVHGSYGSCSRCDALESEFDGFSDTCDRHAYSENLHGDCAECIEARRTYQDKVAGFGKQYLEDVIMTFDEALKLATKYSDWDMEADAVKQWLEKYRPS